MPGALNPAIRSVSLGPALHHRLFLSDVQAHTKLLARRGYTAANLQDCMWRYPLRDVRTSASCEDRGQRTCRRHKAPELSATCQTSGRRTEGVIGSEISVSDLRLAVLPARVLGRQGKIGKDESHRTPGKPRDRETVAHRLAVILAILDTRAHGIWDLHAIRQFATAAKSRGP